MQQNLANRGPGRRHFIGGSDARIIVGKDEKGPDPPVAGKARRGRARSHVWGGGHGGWPTSSHALPATGLFQQPRFTEADSRTATIILDELNASSFQRLA